MHARLTKSYRPDVTKEDDALTIILSSDGYKVYCFRNFEKIREGILKINSDLDVSRLLFSHSSRS